MMRVLITAFLLLLPLLVEGQTAFFSNAEMRGVSGCFDRAVETEMTLFDDRVCFLQSFVPECYEVRGRVDSHDSILVLSDFAFVQIFLSDGKPYEAVLVTPDMTIKFYK